MRAELKKKKKKKEEEELIIFPKLFSIEGNIKPANSNIYIFFNNNGYPQLYLLINRDFFFIILRIHPHKLNMFNLCMGVYVLMTKYLCGHKYFKL